MDRPTPLAIETGRSTTPAPERTIVVGAYRRERASTLQSNRGGQGRSPETRLEEAVGLARAIDLDVVQTRLVALNTLTPATYLGKGKVEEIGALIQEFSAGLVVMDCALSPVQQRNLEKAWNAKVLDRTGLILEIFGRRARTNEGALQVEHAHLTYQKGRLVRSWTHLERQRGGFGFLGGPGETQLETDRRLIEDRLARIERDLATVKRTRALHRRSRKRVPYPVLALVGYTNAGKSTLFNRLTKSEVLAADLLFATLDPTLRIVKLPNGASAILSDTVGFISDLPTSLIAAFRATLEEVIEADLILHVRDISHPDTDAQAADVAHVLRELGIEVDKNDALIELWNKVDQLSAEALESTRNVALRQTSTRPVVLVSALTGEGLPTLADEIERSLSHQRLVYTLTLEPEDGEGLGWLHRNTEVLERQLKDDGRTWLRVRADKSKVGLIERRFSGAERASDPLSA